MSKPQHPYPLPVRRAVAETIAKQVLVMREWSDLTQQTREAFLRDADDVLTALWEASRVDTPDQLDKLADQAIIHDGYFHYEKDVYAWLGGTGYEYIPSYEMSLPSHVIYWGDSDE